MKTKFKTFFSNLRVSFTKFRQKNNQKSKRINHIIARAVILNIILAMLVMPSGMCSKQHQIPLYRYFQFERSETAAFCPDAEILDMNLENLRPEPENPDFSDVQDTGPETGSSPSPYDQFILRAAEAYQVDPNLIKAVIMAESNYNPLAVSEKGAKGLMQLMPVTAKSLGVEEPFDPELNINGGVRYLRQLLDRFDGAVDLALAAYNAGSRYVREYGGVPPFQATHQYIEKVLEYQKKYRQETAAEESGASAV